MARMIPDVPPPDTASLAEVQLFRAFGTELPDDWTVYHSLPWLKRDGRRLRKGECDFLVFAPNAGLLAIEAKTGIEGFDGGKGGWRQHTGDGRLRVIKDPVVQAARSIETMVAHAVQRLGLRSKVEFPLPYGHAAAFPDARRFRGRLPAHVTPELLLFAQDLPRLESRIRAILALNAPPRRGPLPQDQRDALHEAILPCFHLVRDLGSHVQAEKEQLRRLTDFQARALVSMVRQRRMLIEGCAGSGKTLLAAHKAVALERQGARVLLLCFNILLAGFLEDRVRKLGGKSVTVRYIEQLCEETARRAGLPVRRPANATRSHYDERNPLLLLEAAELVDLRFDAILVDEGQDFHPNYWEPIQVLLADERSHFHIFYDPNQNLFGQKQEFPIDGPPAVLPVNCRNTQAIAEYAHRQLGVDLPCSEQTPAGLPVEEHACRDAAGERDAVQTVLEQLVKEGGLSPRDIVVLNPHTIKNSSFASHRALGTYRISDDPTDQGERTIAYRTIRRFKGLESPCVLLTGLRDGDPFASPMDRYVAASRAKSLLHVFRLPAP